MSPKLVFDTPWSPYWRHSDGPSHGAICWQTYDKVKDLSALAHKCARKHGFIDRYSFGIRYEIYRRFHREPGFVLRATDVKPPPPKADLDALLIASHFCLCPSGTGWGMRAFHSAALGCIPVIIQDDGELPPVLQAVEGLVLDWRSFALRLSASDVPHLPSILRSLLANRTAMDSKRAALASTWNRLVWRVALPRAERALLANVPDAFESVMEYLGKRLRYGERADKGRADKGLAGE